ncbi:ImmA/IrrE family metallo-endopeptidase [Scytonema sp. PRP1]|uniref:ImmA/IrrE family metallo-endopeptidase n=1 Tax=Scytonema sp. PRP1 TaxID=3120513 RepID=UPI00300D4FC2
MPVKAKFRRGFKKEASAYSREFRAELGLKPHDPLCPWQLAEHLAIPIVPLSEFQHKIPDEVRYLTEKDPKSFSAITVFYGTQRIIVHNDAHSPLRQASNVSHELSHGILQHQPDEVFNECGCRNFNQEYEDEANWLAPALLISEEAALHIVKTGMTIDEAVEYYRASKEVINMRINVTGARKRISSLWRAS